MATKKQKEMIKEAIYRVNNSLCDSGAWGSLFEDNENNTNAIIIGLINEIERDTNFSLQVEKLEDYMPQEVLSYAKYKNIISGASVPDYEPLITFLNKVDDINRFNTKITPDLWEHLNRYYITPLESLLKDLEDFTIDTLD